MMKFYEVFIIFVEKLPRKLIKAVNIAGGFITAGQKAKLHLRLRLVERPARRSTQRPHVQAALCSPMAAVQWNINTTSTRNRPYVCRHRPRLRDISRAVILGTYRLSPLVVRKGF
ncbi:hypothetical protein J6590_073243 [Homalodisca vitripennis]|nr:hypothetical protein J6590_073243 [Homalodisca vitripennis]